MAITTASISTIGTSSLVPASSPIFLLSWSRSWPDFSASSRSLSSSVLFPRFRFWASSALSRIYSCRPALFPKCS